MYHDLFIYAQKPAIYSESSSKFWDDAHISKGMLAAHLNPTWDAATRNHQFIDQSVAWIIDVLPPSPYHKLLDLGCGPGIYAERFYESGYQVTGIDLSERSIGYAINSARKKYYTIDYRQQNYLTLEEENKYDAATLIYCDFGVLSDAGRDQLLKIIYRSLKDRGSLILDVFTPMQYENREESKTWCFYERGGFWKEDPHICLNAFYRYDKEHTILNQSVILTDQAVSCYNIWEHLFTREELVSDLLRAGFNQVDLYSDIAGKPYHKDSNILCAIARKNSSNNI